MIRSEVRELAWHWREVFVGVCFVALFGLWASNSFGAMRWVAFGFTALALVFAFAAIQRARFGSRGAGYGVVEVDEGVVSYFTAYTGGQIEIAALRAVTLIPAEKGAAHWQLDSDGQTPLTIPLDAIDADKLFDVFVSLEGIQTEAMLRQIKQLPTAPVVVWKKRTLSLH